MGPKSRKLKSNSGEKDFLCQVFLLEDSNKIQNHFWADSVGILNGKKYCHQIICNEIKYSHNSPQLYIVNMIQLRILKILKPFSGTKFLVGLNIIQQ